jgi:hypothetical protein
MEGKDVRLTTEGESASRRTLLRSTKYVGLYKVDEVVTEGATYRIELAPEMRRRGIRPTFHASLLKPHVPHEDTQ